MGEDVAGCVAGSVWLLETVLQGNQGRSERSPQVCPRRAPRRMVHIHLQGVPLLVHGGFPPASITQKRPNHGQVSVHGEPKFIEGQQPYVQ